jgi:hypothetical protein
VTSSGIVFRDDRPSSRPQGGLIVVDHLVSELMLDQATRNGARIVPAVRLLAVADTDIDLH